ncbi:MAG: hypothetical protein Q9215_002497 [Flavoplaca cf. flavocitrina]
MISLQSVFTCLYFALVVVALLPPPPTPGTDPCGPFDHTGDAGFNTCFSSVTPGGPAPYGIVCGADGGVTQAIRIDSCAKSARDMCISVAQGDMKPGEWHWTDDYNGPSCRVGVYLSTTIAGAVVPNYRRCLNQVFQPLILSCIKPPYNVGTVNLRSLPNVTEVFPGETVNPAYPAYIVAPVAYYHSVDPPATANCFGDPGSGFSQADIENQQRLRAQRANSTQANDVAAAEAGEAGAGDRLTADGG